MDATAAAPLNGTSESLVDRGHVEDLLTGEPLTIGYRPTLPLWALWSTEAVPQFHLLRDIELMLIHPVVRNALNYFKGAVAGVEFDVQADGEDLSQFVLGQCQKFWDRGVPKLQGGYEYGWIACENQFVSDGGIMRWDDCIQFSPRDVFLLTLNAVPVGMRIKQIRQEHKDPRIPESRQGKGTVDLWMASEDIPAKGLWYTHNPRYSQFYGQSQLLGAWRPWRRLAWKDGAETVIDGGVYRFAYSGPIVRYPEEDRQAATVGAPGTTLDSQGRPRRFARDVARQMAELYKTGAGIGLPSNHYPSDLGGGPKWDFNLPTSTLNVSGLIEYARYLQDQISIGVGVPPELLQASETGSGYSGRAIPLEGFLMQQQQLADAMLALFVRQVLIPLVRWNWGTTRRFEAKIKNLIETKRNAQQGKSPSGQPLDGEQRQQGGQAPTPELYTGKEPLGEENPEWRPYTNPGTRQTGWISKGGRVVYGQEMPQKGADQGRGFSLDGVRPDHVLEVTRRILKLGKVA